MMAGFIICLSTYSPWALLSAESAVQDAVQWPHPAGSGSSLTAYGRPFLAHLLPEVGLSIDQVGIDPLQVNWCIRLGVQP